MEKEKSRLMQKFGYLQDKSNVNEFDWGNDVGKEVLPPYDAGLLSRFENYNPQDYLNDSQRPFDKGQPKGRELW